MKSSRLAIPLLSLVSTMGSAAFAQDAPGDRRDDALTDIVVVAQKRAEPLQSVPVAVGVVTGESINRLNLTSFDQLARYVPNLTVTETASGNRITLRGINSGTNRGFEQSVGLFVDGVYAGRARQFSVPFYDVDRVEVLRGPQGVLFGKNTVAGAISVLTARPANETFISMTAGHEFRFGENQLAGVLNYRFDDRLKVRLSGRISRADEGFLRNTLTGRREQGRDQNLGRISVAWEPANDVLVDAKYEYSTSRTTGGRFQLISAATFGPQFALYDPKFETNLDLRSSTGNATPTTDRIRAHNAAVSVRIPAAGGELVSQSGFSSFKSVTRNDDSDFTPAPLLFFNNDEKFRQFSQELRFESSAEESITYTVGLYYQTNKYVGIPEFLFSGSVVRFPNTRSLRNFDQRADTYSGFGEVGYKFTPELRLIAGLRYSAENKRADRSLAVLDFASGQPQTNPATLAFTRAALATQNFRNTQKIKERQFIPAATLQYDISDGVMAYGRFARGNKAGGFDASDTLGTAQPYLAESVTGYEAGLKMRLGSKATVNLAAFRSTFTNLQVQAFNGLSFLTTNAGKARSTGVEVDARWRVSREFMLTGSAAYTDAKYLDYRGAACTTAQSTAFTASGAAGSCLQNLSGRPLTDAPRWSGSFNVNYNAPLAGGWRVDTNAGLNYRSSHFVATDLDPLGFQKGYGSVDLSTGIVAPSERFSLTLLARNVGDVRAQTAIVNAVLFTGAKSVAINEPRTIQLRASVRF
jgi:iron complex outermembrane receptor protein